MATMAEHMTALWWEAKLRSGLARPHESWVRMNQSPAAERLPRFSAWAKFWVAQPLEVPARARAAYFPAKEDWAEAVMALLGVWRLPAATLPTNPAHASAAFFPSRANPAAREEPLLLEPKTATMRGQGRALASPASFPSMAGPAARTAEEGPLRVGPMVAWKPAAETAAAAVASRPQQVSQTAASAAALPHAEEWLAEECAAAAVSPRSDRRSQAA